VPAGISFRELAGQVRRRVLDALDHAVAFPRLVEAIRPHRDPGRSPLLQVMVVLQQAPAGRTDLGAFAVGDEDARLVLGGLDVRPYRLAERGAAFDLAMTMAEVNGGLTVLINYCADLFDAPAVARLAGHFTTLLTRALSNQDTAVTELDLLGAEERSAVLALAAGPAVPFDDQTTLHALFARCAATNADATAVVSGERGEHTLTYRELHDRVGQLATRMVAAHDVGRSDLVAVCLPRGPDVLVAFWAALASGGVYLPLPPDLPPRRLSWLLGDARPSVLLTHRDIADRLPDDGPPRICLDEPWPPVAAEAVRIGDRGGPDDLAYALYTSGSTGHPKAVLLTHRGACNLAHLDMTGMQITPASRVLQLVSCAFDVHVGDIVEAHLSGASLHVPPPAATVPGQALVDLLAERRITHLCGAPSVLAALPSADLPDLTHILCGGEAVPAEVVTRWVPGRWFANGYGPAETTVLATVGRCQPDGRRPPIGRPVQNARVYILDERREPVPIGIPGEIFVGGVGVGRGYLGRPELTAERFGADPFADPDGSIGDARLYRTGDRARWLPDGTIDFLGRLDDQVKIRGIRVEPGEIEARLRDVVGHGEVAVLARPAPAGGDELVAYLGVRGPRRPVAELRLQLRAELPGPWVPGAFVYLDTLPLNRSGKLDRAALPAPTAADRGVTDRVPPRTELERLVARVWAGVLDQPSIGVRDHFFDELGGSSLLVTTVTSELGRQLGREVPVTWLFEHPTVEALARALAATEPDHLVDREPDDQAARRRRALAQRRGSSDD